MTPIKTPNATAEYCPPKGWDHERDGHCGNLSVRTETQGIRNYHFSNWKPSPGELAMLNAGGTVELCCVGIQPPVALGVLPPSE